MRQPLLTMKDMTKEINKDGQAIGRKGSESRARLLEAARRLINELPSARKLTASSIARAAGLASQTFYLYFDDIDEILLSLAMDASYDTDDLIVALDDPGELMAPREYAERVVAAFYRYWDRHRAILNIRNYLSDRGDEPFAKVRNESAVPIIVRVAARIRAAQGEARLTERDSMARAVIVFSSIERMAARYASTPGLQLMPGGADLKRAEADILALLLSPPPVLS
jgi:AcrR family transcriptional regulator